MPSQATQQEPIIVFALLEQILALVRQSGATEEESLAAIQSAEAILPTLKLESKLRQTIRGY
jgi:hypothetical protein